MPPKKKTKRTKTSKPEAQQVSFTLKPGAKVQVTIEAGRRKAGKMPVTLHVEELTTGRPAGVKKSQTKTRLGEIAGRLRAGFDALASRLNAYDLPTWLFIGAVALYLITRLIGLTQYPLYFFTDEAIQSQSMADLVANGYRDPEGHLLPTYFRNGEYFNLSLSVYLQWIPLILFGKSAVVTRATSVFITLIAAISVGIILRDAFKMKYWWLGTLFLSITPSWFLHSRTAFETAEFTAFYAGTLCAYLLYRYRDPRYLYLVFFLGALAFYSYSPGQVIVPMTSLALLVSDWRYHWEQRATALRGSLLLVLLGLPFLRFRLSDPDNALAHLHTLGSYLLAEIPLSVKLRLYFTEYLTGLSASYWYVPNNRDLERHLMKDYGNIMIATLPFAILGLAHVLRHVRESAHRAVLIVFLVSPVAAALVQTGITRALVFVIPAALFTAIGLELVLRWVQDPNRQLVEPSRGAGFTRSRVLAALAILLPGSVLAWFCKENIDRVAVFALAGILALQVSGTWEWLAKRIKRSRTAVNLKRWTSSQTAIAAAVFIALSVTNVHLLTDALKNGPIWSNDYGMGGMQYGAFQIFDVLKEYKQEHPQTRIVLTPNWANGTDVVARFFVDDPLPFDIGSIQGYVVQKFPLDDDTLFIMLREEYDLAVNSGRFKDIQVEKTIPYPNGTPGFYFVRLRYADDADEKFAAEKALRAVLQEAVVSMEGQNIKVRHSYLESSTQAEAIQLVFDGNPYSLAKTFEANPFNIEMTFPAPRQISGFSIVIGSASAKITLKCYETPEAEPVIYVFAGQGSLQQPELSFDLPEAIQVQVLQLEMLDPYSPPPTQIHIWEVTLR